MIVAELNRDEVLSDYEALFRAPRVRALHVRRDVRRLLGTSRNCVLSTAADASK